MIKKEKRKGGGKVKSPQWEYCYPAFAVDFELLERENRGRFQTIR